MVKMIPTETIYRVSLPNGETMHTGYKPLAEVWAKGRGAIISEISLMTPPTPRCANTVDMFGQQQA